MVVTAEVIQRIRVTMIVPDKFKVLNDDEQFAKLDKLSDELYGEIRQQLRDNDIPIEDVASITDAATEKILLEF